MNKHTNVDMRWIFCFLYFYYLKLFILLTSVLYVNQLIQNLLCYSLFNIFLFLFYTIFEKHIAHFWCHERKMRYLLFLLVAIKLNHYYLWLDLADIFHFSKNELLSYRVSFTETVLVSIRSLWNEYSQNNANVQRQEN